MLKSFGLEETTSQSLGMFMKQKLSQPTIILRVTIPNLDAKLNMLHASVDEVSSILVHQAPHQQPDNNISLEYFPKIKPSQA